MTIILRTRMIEDGNERAFTYENFKSHKLHELFKGILDDVIYYLKLLKIYDLVMKFMGKESLKIHFI